MKLSELKAALVKNPEAELRFRLPDGEFAPAHSHVTEVARVDKRFVDCGGTLRTESFCRLQIWSANDIGHRLVAGKLLKIFSKTGVVLQSDELEVDVEHEISFISQFPLERIEAAPGQIIFYLGLRHTACLAMDKCGVAPAEISAASPMKFNFHEPSAPTKCCA